VLAQSLSTRQISTKAKMERFIIRKSEHSVIIRDLSFFCTEQHLQTLVACYGDGIKVHLCRSEEANHRSLLHAFVELGSEEAVMNLIDELNGVVYMGRQMKIQRCQGHLSMQDMISLKQIKHGIQVHVRFESMEEKSHNLVTEERLRDIFSDCGAIEDAIVQRHSQNLWKQKGYGFIFFEEMECAERAVQSKNGVMFDNVYYQAAFTHKTKEKLNEMSVSGSVDFGAPSYDNYQHSIAPSFSISMSRDEYNPASAYGMNPSSTVNQEVNTNLQKYGYPPAAPVSRETTSYGSYAQMTSSPAGSGVSTYSRAGDSISATTSLESGGIIGLGQVRSQQQSPSSYSFGGQGSVMSRTATVETDDERSTVYTPQHPNFLTPTQRAFSTASSIPSDGMTTADPSPSAGYNTNSYSRSFLLENETNTYSVGIAAVSKDASFGTTSYGSQTSSPSANSVPMSSDGNMMILPTY